MKGITILTHTIEIGDQTYCVTAHIDRDMLVEVQKVELITFNGSFRCDITGLLDNYGDTLDVLANTIEWAELYAEYCEEMRNEKYEYNQC
jgi:hypothetical protein